MVVGDVVRFAEVVVQVVNSIGASGMGYKSIQTRNYTRLIIADSVLVRNSVMFCGV